MSEIDTSMTYYGAFPKPLFFNETLDLEKTENRLPSSEKKFKILNNDVTMNNLGHLVRDLTLPFEVLNYFGKNGRSEKDSNTQPADPIKTKNFKLRAKITEVHLLILRKSEKNLSLANIPNLLANCLTGVKFENYIEISQSFINVLWTWIDAQKIQTPQRLRITFRTRTKNRIFDFEKLSFELERIFLEGYISLRRPSFTEFSGQDFLNCLKHNNISFSGPFKTEFNGEKLGSIFTLSNINSLRFFNNDRPLYGLFQFPKSNFKNYETLEDLPAWYFEQPAIANYELDKLIFNFQKQSIV